MNEAYVGRTVDVLAFQPAASGAGLMTQSLLEPVSRVCTGTQKLAQQWVLCFLTPLGSTPYRATYGGEFPLRMQQGAIRTDSDVSQYFYESATSVFKQLQAVTTEETPLDERLVEASLTSFSIDGDHLTLRVMLTTEAGTSREIIVPIATVP